MSVVVAEALNIVCAERRKGIRLLGTPKLRRAGFLPPTLCGVVDYSVCRSAHLLLSYSDTIRRSELMSSGCQLTRCRSLWHCRLRDTAGTWDSERRPPWTIGRRLNSSLNLVTTRWCARNRISSQDLASHEDFIAKNGLTVPLLADVDKSVARSYSAHSNRLGIKRAAIVIDEQGIVRDRHDHLLGLDYQSVDDLKAALDALPSPATG